MEPGLISLTPAPASARAVKVSTTDEELTVVLDDGRTIVTPLSNYPRLDAATPEELAHWRFVGGGERIFWEKLEEDVGIDALIEGRPSRESAKSLKRWLSRRNSARGPKRPPRRHR
jgi:hypothetical protein